MCFGNDAPSAPQIGAPPPLQEMMDMLDEITGTQSVIVTGADGKKRRVNSRLPRSPEEEKRFTLAEKLISGTMQNMMKLYKYDPKSMIDYAPLIETFSSIDENRMKNLAEVANIGNIRQDVEQFQAMKNSLIDEEFALETQANEERLAHSGRGSGTYAAESRAAMARARSLARQEGSIQASIYGEDMAARRLGTNKEAFGLQEVGRQGQLESAMGKYDVLKGDESEQEQRRQTAIAEQQNLMGVGTGVVDADLNKALQNTNAATAIGEYNAVNGAQMNRFNADVNRQQANYNMAMQEHNAKGPSFMEGLVNTGTRLGAAYLSGGMSEGAKAGMGARQGSSDSRVGINTTGRMRRY